MESHTFSKKYLSKSVDGLLSNTFSICRTIPTDKIDAYQLGFQLFGPMMYEFCRWIHEYNNGETSLLFLSREGEFIKQCYDLMYPENASIIVYLSRQSILQCMAYMMFCKYSVEEFREAIYLVNYEKISGVLRRIGLDVEQYKSLLESCGLTAEDRFDKRIDIFFQRNKSKILEELKEKFNPISVEYLNQCLTKGDTLVDIGWRGSMQKLLQRFVDLQGKNISLMGLYLGIDDTDHKAGFLYQDKGKNRQNIRCFSQLLEVITTPNHGSTIGYRKTAGGIMPVFAPNEFADNIGTAAWNLGFDSAWCGVAFSSKLSPRLHYSESGTLWLSSIQKGFAVVR